MEKLKFELRQSKINEAAESEKCSNALSERHRMEEEFNTQVFKARHYFEKYKTLKKTMELNKEIIENTSCLDCTDQRKENDILKTMIEKSAIITVVKLKENKTSVSPITNATIINQPQETTPAVKIQENQNDISAVMKCNFMQCNFKGSGAIDLKLHLVNFHNTENVGTDWEKFFRGHYSIEIVICKYCKEIFKTQRELKFHGKLHEKEDAKLEVTMSKLSNEVKNLTEKIDKPCNECSNYKKEINALKSLKNTDKNFSKYETQMDLVDENVDLAAESEILENVDNSHPENNTDTDNVREVFENTSDKKSPKKSNKRKKAIPCQVCGSSFTKNSSLKHHVETIHERKKPHKCTFCHESFSAKSNLTRHVNSIHVTDKPLPFSCKKCKRGFKRSDNLKAHKELCEEVSVA